jgi:hypothetical protein
MLQRMRPLRMRSRRRLVKTMEKAPRECYWVIVPFEEMVNA